LNALGAGFNIRKWPECLKNASVGWLQLPRMDVVGGDFGFYGVFCDLKKASTL